MKINRLVWNADGSAQIAEIKNEKDQTWYLQVQFGANNGISSISSDPNMNSLVFEAYGDVNDDPTTEDFRTIRESIKSTIINLLELL